MRPKSALGKDNITVTFRELQLETNNPPSEIRASGEHKATVVVAMSGGVDSSTAAAMLQFRNYQVMGMTMQMWDQRRLAAVDPSAPKSVKGRCCSLYDVYDARRVAEHLDFPFSVVNFER